MQAKFSNNLCLSAFSTASILTRIWFKVKKEIDRIRKTYNLLNHPEKHYRFKFISNERVTRDILDMSGMMGFNEFFNI